MTLRASKKYKGTRSLFEPVSSDKDGNEIPKGMPKPRGQNSVADMLTRFRAFIIWAIDNNYTINNPFKHFTIGEIVYGTPIYISNEERNRLLEADMSDDKEIETQRDILFARTHMPMRQSKYRLCSVLLGLLPGGCR